jgi:guanylate kinase
MTGKLIIFAAPSGSGKTTIVKHLLDLGLNLSFSISATTRAKRDNETDGVDYFFLTKEAFQAKVKENAFLEWEEVYEGTYYGTLKTEVDKELAQGKNILFDIDVKGALNIKKIYGNQAMALFVKPPSIEILEERLRIRNTESEETFKTRIGKAAFELNFEDQFDITIINENIEEAREEARLIIENFISA